MPRAFAAFTTACLVVAVVTQAGPLLDSIRWFAGEAASARPYDLRLPSALLFAVVLNSTAFARAPLPVTARLTSGGRSRPAGRSPAGR